VYARRMRTRIVHHHGVTSTAGDWRSVAAWLCVLALACGRAENAPSSSLPTDVGASDEDEPAASGPNEASMGDDDTNDAGASLPSSDSAECPAPRPGATPGVAAGWARDPATGGCCRYTNRTSAPSGWLRFDDEASCKTGCLCSALEGFEGDFEDLLPVRDSLECRCSLESCPSTLEEAEQRLCAVAGPFPPAVERHVGCGGVVVVFDNNGQSGSAWTFQPPSESGDPAAAAPRLVGAATLCGVNSSDSDPCHRAPWPAGRDFGIECDYGPVIACQVCGDSPDTDYPPCP
jgi:hypothetical protein